MENYFLYSTERTGSTFLGLLIENFTDVTNIPNCFDLYNEYFSFNYGKDDKLYWNYADIKNINWDDGYYHNIPFIDNELKWIKIYDKNYYNFDDMYSSRENEIKRRIKLLETISETNKIFFRLQANNCIRDINWMENIKNKYKTILLERKNRISQYLSYEIAYHINRRHRVKNYNIPSFNLTYNTFIEFNQKIEKYDNTKNYWNVYDIIYYEDLIVHKEKLLKFKLKNSSLKNTPQYNYIPGRYKKENFINLEEAIDWFKDSPYKNQIDEALYNLI